MYNIGLDNIEIILSYYDIFEGEMPDLVEEIKSLNMHKAISIICELIAAKDYKIKVNTVFSLEMDVPYEMALKKMLCEIQATSPEDLNANPLLRKDKHIISLQMLLILLKKLFIYGDYSTLYMDDYEINLDDYKKIVKLQLIIAEKMNDEFEIDKVDMSHFLYGTYHVNYDRNVANEFIRTYYMFEKIGKDKYNFEEDIQGEYKDYYGDFTAKYGYTPTQYIFILFWELSVYFQYEKRLTFHSIWREVGEIYGSTGLKAIAAKVISDLSSDAIGYQEWAEESEKDNGIFKNS